MKPSEVKTTADLPMTEEKPRWDCNSSTPGCTAEKPCAECLEDAAKVVEWKQALKPLHVRVAEALGWTKTREGRIVVAGRDLGPGPWEGQPPFVHGDPPVFWPRALWPIPRYDTDWPAAGPLMFKYGITVGPAYAGRVTDQTEWAADYAQKVTSDNSVIVTTVRADHPLKAVCLLILALRREDGFIREDPRFPWPPKLWLQKS